MPRTFRSNRVAIAAGALAPVLAGTLVLSACGDDGDDGDTARFCEAVAANQEALFNTPIASPADVDEYVALYREVGENAPLAIEADWDVMTEMFGTAEQFEPDSTIVAEQDVLAGAYSSYPSALAVRDWLAENCQITITVAEMPAPSLQVTGTTPSSTGEASTG